MHPADQWIRLTNHYRRGKDLLATQSRKLPYAGKGERLQVLPSKAIGLLAIVALLPFVKTSSRNEAAALCECLSKQR